MNFENCWNKAINKYSSYFFILAAMIVLAIFTVLLILIVAPIPMDDYYRWMILGIIFSYMPSVVIPVLIIFFAYVFHIIRIIENKNPTFRIRNKIIQNKAFKTLFQVLNGVSILFLILCICICILFLLLPYTNISRFYFTHICIPILTLITTIFLIVRKNFCRIKGN